jgi:homogentisate 1,2-dioxygenase
MVDFGDGAIPCPYPHSSPDCDEILFYVEGNFTSRKGVGPASITLHPRGLVHGPHPGTYEASVGVDRTDELAVMVDTFRELQPTEHAIAVEDRAYNTSWVR